jgi:hypothetical protein
MAQFIHLTGRADQSAIETITTSNLSYDRGGHFRRCGSQGCKKSARIKPLVDDTFREKTLSIIQTNCSIKAVKDKKITKM